MAEEQTQQEGQAAETIAVDDFSQGPIGLVGILIAHKVWFDRAGSGRRCRRCSALTVDPDPMFRE